MKKVLLVSALVMTIVASMVSGTLAVYHVTLDPTISGSVNPAEFRLTGSGVGSFTTGVSIAPSETVEMQFTVSNKDGSIVSEVPMDLAITVNFAAADLKEIIIPLTAVLKDSTGTIISTDVLSSGAGDLSIADVLTDTTIGETKTYTVVITWLEADPTVLINPADYANKGTKLTVNVEGTQIV